MSFFGGGYGSYGGSYGGGYGSNRRFEEQYHCYSVAYADKPHLEVRFTVFVWMEDFRMVIIRHVGCCIDEWHEQERHSDISFSNSWNDDDGDDANESDDNASNISRFFQLVL